MSFRKAARRAKPLLAASGLILMVVLIMTLVLLSPFLVGAVFGTSRAWVDLANIGQAYGGAAALISAIALVGIAVSLLVQWRQTRLQQIFAVRERHFELLKLSLEHPELRTLFGSDANPDKAADPRLIYLSLFIGHLANLWDLREITEEHLRLSLNDLFGTAAARSWWRHNGPSWSNRLTRQRTRFHEILDQECAALELKAINGGREGGLPQAKPSPPDLSHADVIDLATHS